MSRTKKIIRINNPELKTIKQGWAGNVTIDGRFYNGLVVVRSLVWSVLKWKLSTNAQKTEKRSDTFKLQKVAIGDLSSKEDRIIWLGHSSFFISVNGVRIITDPCLFDLPAIKRKVGLPCNVNDLKQIDYLLISHNHRDHLDKRSINKLMAINQDLSILAPLGSQSVLRGLRSQQAGWFQEFELDKGVRIVFLPAKHWSRRGLTDYNKVLWGSFMIIHGDRKIFFMGDSAYDKNIFQEIHTLFGEVDICLLPIGAYSPQWIMAREHMNPEEALEVFADMAGGHLIPMHYGTYDLTDEPLGEPISRLRKRALELGLSDRVVELAVGQQYNML